LVPWYHRFAITLLLPLPYISIYLCNKTGPDAPHIISPASYARNASLYPYDYKLFHPNMNCRTCLFPKLARSKHCSLCRACVARADHHCVWVNNCLGRGNYKYFLALLLSTTSLLAYTAQLTYLTLAPQVRDHLVRYPTQHAKLSALLLTSQPGDGRGWWADQVLIVINGYLDTFNTALVVGGVARSGVGLLALIAAPLPAGLLAYHAYLVWAGMTTNESNKWSDWRVELANGSGYVAPIVGSDESSQCAPHRWPKRSRQILVLTSDGLPPRNLQPEIKAVVGEHAEWRRLRSLNGVDNAYDLGPWRNLVDVLLD
jgi:palmitoyltransferase